MRDCLSNHQSVSLIGPTGRLEAISAGQTTPEQTDEVAGGQSLSQLSTGRIGRHAFPSGGTALGGDTMPARSSVEGFAGLVGRFQPEGPLQLPRRTSQIWDALIYPAFLGRGMRSAQAAYLSELLGRHLDYAHRTAARSDPGWGGRIQADIDAERRGVPPGSVGARFKRPALASAERLSRHGDLANMVCTADSFFRTNGVTSAFVTAIASDRPRQMDLVTSAAADIAQFGPVKAVLWLHDFGLGRELAPPNLHIRHFLHEHGFRDASLDDDAESLHALTVVCQRMREVANDVSRELGRAVSVRLCQHAAWLWETCRGLLALHHKASRLTVRRLLEFLDSRG